MQRTYRERKYTCGDYIEVAIYLVYTQQRGRSTKELKFFEKIVIVYMDFIVAIGLLSLRDISLTL